MSSTLPPFIPPAPRAAQLLDLPKELFIHISRYLSTESLLNFLRTNREINQLCTLVLETPTAESGDLQRAIAWHATHDSEEKLMRILRNSRQKFVAHHESQFEALSYACAVGFENLIEWLIELGIDPEIRSSDPNRDTELKRQGVISPLMAAARRNDPNFLAQFLRHFARPTGYYIHEIMLMLFGPPDNIKDHAGAEVLVGAGLNQKIMDFDGTTTLHYAATHYGEEEVRFLARHGVDVAARGGTNNANALAYAIQAGNIGVIPALLDAGANVNQQCNLTTFPLFVAAIQGDPAIIQLLVDRGADPNQIVLASGGTPFAEASRAMDDNSENAAIALLDAGASFSVHLRSTEDILWRAINSHWTTFLRAAFRALQARNEPLIAGDAFFVAAAHLGDIELMDGLLATGTINVNYQLPMAPGRLYGYSALGEAVSFGGEDAVEWLIQRAGVTKFDFIDRFQSNLYHKALELGHPDRERTIRHLLAHLDPEELLSPNSSNVTPLALAIETQPHAMIHLLLAHLPPIANQLVRRESYAHPLSACLCTAAASGNLEVFQLLVDYMDSNQIGLRPERSPLYTALQNKRRAVAEFAVQQEIGLDIAIDGVRPIAAAAAVGYTHIVDALLQMGIPADSPISTDRSALVAALMSGNLAAAALLLDAGADTNVPLDDPNFPQQGPESFLIWAAAMNHPDTVRFLLARGWDIIGNHAGVGVGVSPLAHAAANNATACMQALIENGADLELRDADGLTALYHAAWATKLDAVHLLLSAGANPDPSDPAGNTPLIRAAARSFEMTRLLVTAGADINKQSNAGSTALINAAARDQVESVHLLLQRGARLEMRLGGRTALAWAIGEDALGAARVLVGAGADVAAADGQGNTPLSLARSEAALAVLSAATRRYW